MKRIWAITRKELNSYFSSPMALIFVGVFLAGTLFTFFWVDKFFSRGLADVRPLFRWMPTLIIFLVAALTMRQWSEEQQSGTMEMLLTLPAKLYQLVLGKFFAVMGLIIVALLLTLFLPLTISSFGNLDDGPIIGGYLAAILMASAYVAIGLFVSSRTGNQIVALILTILICGAFQMVGSHQITDLFGTSTSEFLRSLGTGSRFESIERGVIDFRDLAYYISIAAIFLVLNTFSLDQKRWSQGIATKSHRFNAQTTLSLVAANLLIFNAIVYPFHGARADLTEDHLYSLSDVTKDTLSNLQEPLLIRAYISEKNHPLLEPLVPYIRDMLDEYEIASNGNLDVEIIDPIKDPKKEAEATQVYGIQSTPLQVSDRYGASVINVYFDILIRYGDQNVVLNFRDLIDVDEYGNGDIDVRLRNLEYDLTRSIRKVVYGFQSIDAVLAALDQPAQLVLYYTPDTLPQDLQSAPDTIQTVAQHISDSSGGKFTYESVNISDPANNIDSQQLYDQYGIQPFAESFLSSDTYYLHMLLTAGGKTQVIYPEGDLSEASVRSSIEGALQRAAPGFMKVVGIWTPTQPQYDVYGQQQQQIQSYDTLTQSLQQNYETQTIDLSTGEVPTNVDILLLVAPENMTDIERYAVDQYLMRGGTVCVFTGNSKLGVDQMNGTLILQPLENGLQDMLSFYGVSIDPSTVLDEQNSVFPIQVARNVGGMQVQEIQAMQYPFFVDVRTNEMNRSNPILAHLNSITMNWASPVIVDQDKNADRQVTTLFHSSPHSWTSTNTDIEPNLNVYPELGFAEGDTMQSYPLAVVVQGSFDSYFKDKPSPFTTSDQTETVAPITGPIDTSPDNARLIVIGSSEFLNDTVFQLVSSMDRQGYVNNLQLVQNVVDWSTEDTDLLALRSRGMSARLLDPMTESKQKRWEVVNYALALASLAVIGGLWQWRKRAEKPMTLVMAPTTAAEVLSYEQNQ